MVKLIPLIIALFCVGTSELLPGGILGIIAASLHVSVTAAGLMVTIYAASVAIIGPIVAILTVKMNRKSLFLLLLAVFFIGNLIIVASDNLSVVLIGRAITASVHGTFMAVAIIISQRLLPAERSGSAVARMQFGLNLATIVGIPFGAAIAQTLMWKAPFLIVGSAALVVALGAYFIIPSVVVDAAPSVKKEIAALLQKNVILIVLSTAAFATAMFTIITYAEQIATKITHFSEAAVPIILIIYGIMTLIGNFRGILILLSIPLAVSFARISSAHPTSNGVMGFVGKAFGTTYSSMTGCIFFIGALAGVPSAAIMGAQYISGIFSGDSTVTAIIALVILVFVGAVLLCGITSSARLQLGLTVLLITLLVLAILGDLNDFHLHNWSPFVPHGWWSIGTAASLLMFAFVGWEAVTPLSAEFKNPSKDIIISTALALLLTSLTSVLYLSLASMSIGVLGKSIALSKTPIMDLMTRGFGPFSEIVTAVIAMILTVGAINAYAGGAAKMGASLAAEGIFPRYFQSGHEPGKIARKSIIATITLATITIISFGNFPSILNFTLSSSSACFTPVYVFGCAAIVTLQSKPVDKILAVISLIFVCVLLIFSGIYVLVPIVLALLVLTLTWLRKFLRQSAPIPGS